MSPGYQYSRWQFSQTMSISLPAWKRASAFFAFTIASTLTAPDPKVRANRLTLLGRLFNEFSTIADFSEIVTSGDSK